TPPIVTVLHLVVKAAAASVREVLPPPPPPPPSSMMTMTSAFSPSPSFSSPSSGGAAHRRAAGEGDSGRDGVGGVQRSGRAATRVACLSTRTGRAPSSTTLVPSPAAEGAPASPSSPPAVGTAVASSTDE
ncbi:unnamed protein product, partial [Scytosiphon promiscuus]